MPKYRDLFLNESFKLKYQSTITNYENKIICKISKSEFNNSLNPTLRIGNTEESNELKKFVTSNEFRTYITEIGLYDDYGRLLVIGKLPHPIQNKMM